MSLDTSFDVLGWIPLLMLLDTSFDVIDDPRLMSLDYSSYVVDDPCLMLLDTSSDVVDGPKKIDDLTELDQMSEKSKGIILDA